MLTHIQPRYNGSTFTKGAKMNFDIQKLNERFVYDNGKLFFKERKGGRASIGKEAGYINQRGYRKLQVDGVVMGAHQAIFAMHHGFFPTTIDHINQDKSDNRIENLRSCTNQENVFNKGAYKNNKSSGVRGVSWSKSNKGWCSHITFNGRKLYLGTFKTVEEAKLCRLEKENELLSAQ